MCGIAGIFAYAPDAPRPEGTEVRRITDAMASRGPDGSGLWESPENGCVILGHRRLSILDLSATGAQPMQSSDGRLSITFNGEIYNYRALRQDMETRGWRFRSTSDTEVLLALWDAHGPAMVHHLRGMFAFALWDARERSLFLARDPFGIKPLYYADDGKTLRFASQVKALMAGGGIDDTLDSAGLAGFYGLGFVPEPFTTHRAIRALPAGHWTLVDGQGLRSTTPFFALADTLKEAEETALRDPVATLRLRASVPELLLDSVRHHLVSDVPVGIFLSSGLDSSALVSLAKEAGATTLQAVTLGFREFQGRPEDETPLAARVAAHFGATHQVRWLDRQTFAENLDLALRAMDQPSVDGLNTYFVAKAASEAGMKVALSGLGGDELFGGYSSYRQVPRMARLLTPLRACPTLGPIFRTFTRPFTGRRISPKWASLLEYGPHLAGAYFLRRALFLPWEFEALGAPVDLARGWEELDLISRLERSIQGLTTERGRLIALEAGWYMRNQLLRDSDWASMAHGLELRTPLVDATLLRQLAPALVSPTPPDRRQVVAALPTPPPPEVLTRPKTGFSMPIRMWVEEIRGRRGPDRGIRGWGRFLGSTLPGTPTLARLRADLPGARRVLIFRVGSLGDTVVALPSFHLIARAFPQAERWVLTNFPEHRKAPPLSAILGESGLVHGYLEYPPQASTLRKLFRTRRQLRSFRPDLVVYLMPVRTPQQLRRDRIFFRLCGVSHLVGLPDTERQRQGGWDQGTAQWTHEAERLLSTLAPLGSLDLGDPGVWNFGFTTAEEARARQATDILPPDRPVLALSLGTKQPVNEWGMEKWQELLPLLPGLLPGWSLLILGAPEDRGPSEALARAWQGPAVNLCGNLQPRESAAALKRAALFLGLDSGPMHLAAAVGVPCVAIFSARNWPGEWFPFGKVHQVIRHEVPCAGCRLTRCIAQQKQCIASIHPEEVLVAIRITLGEPQRRAL